MAAPIYGSLGDEAATLLPVPNVDGHETLASSAPSRTRLFIGLACAATAMVAGVNQATGGGVVAMLSTKAEAQAKAKAATSSGGLDFTAYSADYSHASALKTASPHSFVKANRLVEPIKDTGGRRPSLHIYTGTHARARGRTALALTDTVRPGLAWTCLDLH